MPQPTPYERSHDFTAYSAAHPSDPHPGFYLDAEFNGVLETLSDVLINLALIQRDDGQLKNGSVGIDQLAEGLLSAISALVAGDIGGFADAAAASAAVAQAAADAVAAYSGMSTPQQVAAAEAARDAALAALDSFDDRYLGAKAADPTTDNDGNALANGTLYWNTTASEMRVRQSGAWVAAYIPGGSYLAVGDPATSLNMATARLLGRSSAGTGAVQELQIGAGLNLAGGVLTASAAASSVAKKTADQTTTSSSLVDISSLAFTPAANKYYAIRAVLRVKSSQSTNNTRFGVAFPTGLSLGSIRASFTDAQLGSQGGANEAQFYDFDASGNFLSNQFAPGTSFKTLIIEGVIAAGATPSGDFKLQYCSDGTRTATLGAGSFLEYREI